MTRKRPTEETGNLASGNGAVTPRALKKAGSPGAGTKTAGVVVTGKLEILQFLGHTGSWLELRPGQARLNLRRMLHPALQYVVSSAIEESRKSGESIRKRRVAFQWNGELRQADVEVHPLKSTALEHVFQVLFRDVNAKESANSLPSAQTGHNGSADFSARASIAKLKREVSATQAAMESMIVEQEHGLAQLKVAYRELETSNAQLAAANEELAVSNAELEAVNLDLEMAIRERDQAEQERRRLEAEIQLSQRLESLRLMAGGVAHDFNNLLTSIVGNASLLLDELPREAPLRDAVEQIEKAGLHGANLTRQMLAFCGKIRLTTEPIELSALVGDSRELIKASISKEIKLRCHLAGNLPAIEADGTQLRQVLINLVTNASEAIGRRDGVIVVSTRFVDISIGQPMNGTDPLPPGRYVCLEVADSGCGITPETKSRLFEPFFSTKFSGRGLGLTAVLGIVRSHSGTIEVSGEPGRGTTVTVLFPPAPETKLPAPAAIAALPALAGRATVLVVDDDDSVRTLAKASLLRAGLRVLLAADGYEALRILREDSEEVTVVLLDLMMPNLDGGEVLRRLRASHPDLPVILTTGYHQQEVLSEELKAGSVGFLPKPFRPKDLLDRIAAVCAGETTPVQTNGLRR